MTQQEFRQIVPTEGGSLILYRFIQGAFPFYGYKIEGVSISRNSCSQQEISNIATDIRKITLNISGSNYTANVSKEYGYETHINYVINPFNVTTHIPPNSNPFDDTAIVCDLGFVSYSLAPNFRLDGEVPVSPLDIGYISHITSGSDSSSLELEFNKTDFNVLYNNVQKGISSRNRFIVDRFNKDVNPINLNSIINDTAKKAEVNEFSYTSIGLANSKYNGSKTTKNEYGTFPAIGATEFKGAVYSNLSASFQQQDLSICSQSTDERSIKSFYFASNKDATSVTQAGGISNTDLPRIRTTRLFFSGSKLDGSTWSAPASEGTSFAVPTFLDVEPGDVLAFGYFLGPGQTSAYENVLVNSIEFISESLNGPIIGTSGSVQRGYLNNIDSVSTLGKSTNWSGGNFFSIHKYTPDIIYEINGNVPYRVVNKRLYLQETGEVFYVDDRGRVLTKTIDC